MKSDRFDSRVPVYTIELPEYNVDSRPDYAAIGPRLDRFLEEHLPRRKLALRGLYLADHPELARAQLVERILELGTDRYDPDRKGMHHDYYDPLGVELHAVSCEITDDGLRALVDPDYLAAESFCGEFIADFYDSAKAERGYPLRLDVLVAYDLEQLEPVPDDRSMAYVFRDAADRPSALAAIINVLGAQQER